MRRILNVGVLVLVLVVFVPLLLALVGKLVDVRI